MQLALAQQPDKTGRLPISPRSQYYDLAMVFICLFSIVNAQDFYHRGQVSVLNQFDGNDTDNSLFSLRYQPELSFGLPLLENMFDVELALNLNTSATYKNADNSLDRTKLRLYRFWFRFSTAQFEARLGLQKISFGSSTLLRPLRWFDRLDPRDPRQLTEGVYGLLFRYYFVNNTNIWLWGLLGNDDPKGWEIIPGSSDNPEWGGRIQTPLGIIGEAGISYHYREADFASLSDPAAGAIIRLLNPDEQEHKLGLDLRLDYVLGMWLEGALIEQDLFQQRLFTIGADYTLPIRDGIQVIGEHMWLETKVDRLDYQNSIPLSAILANYSYGLLDQFTFIVTREWDSAQNTGFLRWGRTYDQWQFYLNGFWIGDTDSEAAPNNDQIPDIGSFTGQDFDNSGLTGKGVQILVVYNY